MAKCCAFCGKTMNMFTTVCEIPGTPFEFCDSHLDFKHQVINVLSQDINADLSSIVREFSASLKNKADTFESAADALISSVKANIMAEVHEKEARIAAAAELAEQKKLIMERRMNLPTELAALMTTVGYSFEGYRIVEYLDIVTGETVLGTGFLAELSASLADTFGETSGTMSSKLARAKELAFKAAKVNCIEKGGNAIIGIDFDYITFANNMIGVIANGTAVRIEKLSVEKSKE